MRLKNKRLILSIALLVIGILLLAVLAQFLWPYIKQITSDTAKFGDYLYSFGSLAIIVFVLLQIAQVIVPAIPNEILHFAGGYVFGAWLGTIYTILGIFIGSVLAFFMARWLGLPVIRYLATDKQLQKFSHIFAGKRSSILLAFVFLLPCVPKDLLTYLFALTPINPLSFLLITTIARFPTNFVPVYLGANIAGGNTALVVILATLACLITIIAFIYQEQIINWVHIAVQRKRRFSETG